MSALASNMGQIKKIKAFDYIIVVEQFWSEWEPKGQLISKANCQAVNPSKKRTNEFVFTSMRRVFVRFLEEIQDSKAVFRNYQTFS